MRKNKMSSRLMVIGVVLMALTIGCSSDSSEPAAPERDIRNAFLEDLESLNGCGAFVLLQGIIYETRKGKTDRPPNYFDQLNWIMIMRMGDNLTASEIKKVNSMIRLVTPDHLDWAFDKVLKHLEDLEMPS